MTDDPDRQTALVTGATSGIGLAFAEQLAQRGFNLILVARGEEELRLLAARLQQEHSVGAQGVALDLSAQDSAERLVGGLGGRRIDLLINNAGFAQYGAFAETDPAVELAMLNLNIVTLTRLTKLILPAMIGRGSGRVLNVASTAAFMPGPLMAVYYASKAYVLSFTEALSEELRGTGCSATVLCPGATRTGFQERASMEESRLVRGRSLLDADAVAREGLDGVFQGDGVVIPGLRDKLYAFVPRLLPRSFVPRLVRSAQAPADR